VGGAYGVRRRYGSGARPLAGLVWRTEILREVGGWDAYNVTEDADLGLRLARLTSAFLGWLGLMRRGLLSTAWVLLLTPLHWLLLSLAAWRAFYQLIAAPYAWEKTEHGLAKSSRLNAATTHSLLELERHLSDLERSGNLPAISERTKDTSANPQRLPRAAA